jgi:magnesium-transporting ATPase (P-type)
MFSGARFAESHSPTTNRTGETKMITEPNTEVLNREIEMITRALGRVAIVLSLVAFAVYAMPDKAADPSWSQSRAAVHAAGVPS